MLHKRLYFITGKGGVGKSLVAQSVSLALSQKMTTLLLNIDDQKIHDSPKVFHSHSPFILDKTIEMSEGHEDFLTEQIQGKVFAARLQLQSISKDYIARKVGSTTLASFVVDNIFFKSLLNVLPSLAALMMLGKVIELLNRYEHLNIVIDAQASGHFLSTISSPTMFMNIFKAGKLFEDAHFIEQRLKEEAMVMITSTTRELSSQEAQELSQKILTKLDCERVFILNMVKSLSKEFQNGDTNDFPKDFLDDIQYEKSIINNFKNQYGSDHVMILPQMYCDQPKEIVENLVKHIVQRIL